MSDSATGALGAATRLRAALRMSREECAEHRLRMVDAALGHGVELARIQADLIVEMIRAGAPHETAQAALEQIGSLHAAVLAAVRDAPEAGRRRRRREEQAE